MHSSLESLWTRRIKWLIQGLILSCSINIGLIATLCYFVFKEKDISNYEQIIGMGAAEEVIHESNEAYARKCATMSYEELIQCLHDKELVEDGYTKRDLALSCLVAWHHFDVERALSSYVQERRLVRFDAKELILFPGLTDCHYEAVFRFVQREMWPFTAEGLFIEIQHKLPTFDPSLLAAFSQTKEVLAVSTMFSRSGVCVDMSVLISLLVDGDFEMIRALKGDKRAFLLDYVRKGSKIAARLFFEIDKEYVLKRLSDQDILLFKQLLPPHEEFSKALAASPRSDAVRGIQIKESAPLQELPLVHTHVVEEGESLWRIARRYKTTVSELMESNQLEGERIRPGRVLKIYPK